MALAFLEFLRSKELDCGGHSRYLVPFHHLPAVSWEPLELPSFASQSAKVRALQGEVDKTLEKGTLELVDHPGLDYYSQLFLMQKTSGVGGGGIP